MNGVVATQAFENVDLIVAEDKVVTVRPEDVFEVYNVDNRLTVNLYDAVLRGWPRLWGVDIQVDPNSVELAEINRVGVFRPNDTLDRRQYVDLDLVFEDVGTACTRWNAGIYLCSCIDKCVSHDRPVTARRSIVQMDGRGLAWSRCLQVRLIEANNRQFAGIADFTRLFIDEDNHRAGSCGIAFAAGIDFLIRVDIARENDCADTVFDLVADNGVKLTAYFTPDHIRCVKVEVKVASQSFFNE